MHAQHHVIAAALPCALLLVVGCSSGGGDQSEAADDATAADVVATDSSAGDTGSESDAADDVQTTDNADTDTDTVTAADTDTDSATDTDTDDSTGADCPGGSGCACQSAADCDNALCLDLPGGKACAQTCVDSCGEDQACVSIDAGGGDVVSVCVPPLGHLCEPCSDNAACAVLGIPGSVCVDEGPLGSFCGVACTADDDCPADYRCGDVKDTAGVDAKQCVREASADDVGPDGAPLPFGTCPCSPDAAKKGLATACGAANVAEDGTLIGFCKGSRKCGYDPDTGDPKLGACDAPAPADETCNGLDDDCNGQTDEASCDDGNGCTTNTCDGANGCQTVKLDGVPCDADASVCTEGDACVDGACLPGTSKDCGDDNPCTIDACDPAAGCTQTDDDGAPCEDGDACTLGDLCAAGACVGGAAKLCPTGKPCVVATCEPSSGDCVPADKADGTPCSDGDACTLADACTAGTCTGAFANCDDGNVCTNDSCDAADGCIHLANQATCTDGSACTVGDACADKQCVPGAPPSCDDGNVCTDDGCDPAVGCTATDNSAPCPDDNVCTEQETCAGGVCTKQPLACDDNDPCTTDSCQPGPGGGCSNVQVVDGTECGGDGALWCQQGACVAKAFCGDGKINQLSEACDDGNELLCDGCEACAKRHVGHVLNGGKMTGPKVGLGQQGTVELWVRTTSKQAPLVNQDIIGFPSQGLADWLIWVAPDGGIVAEIGAGGAPHSVVGPDITDNAWHHVAMTFDASALTLFFDGQRYGSVAVPPGVQNYDAGAGVQVGSWPSGDTQGVDAQLDEIRVSTVVRYSNDFVPVRRHEPDAQTAALWHLDEGTGNAVNDESGNGKHLTLQGDATWAVESCQGAAPDALACGDGKRAPFEACDDGNLDPGDGCDGGCALEPGFDGMVRVDAGPFAMGCNALVDAGCQSNELPQHTVTLSAFWIDAFEVSVADYQACVDAGACQAPGNVGNQCNYGVPGRATWPVNCVDKVAAEAYCAWAGKRLPTEAEWEKAARGGCGPDAPGPCAAAAATYPWGNASPSCGLAQMADGTGLGCGQVRTTRRGAFAAGRSAYGLWDAAGNVAEWVSDFYDGTWYGVSPAVDPQGPAAGVEAVLRGGRWYEAGDGQRSARRLNVLPTVHTDGEGLRCAK